MIESKTTTLTLRQPDRRYDAACQKYEDADLNGKREEAIRKLETMLRQLKGMR